MRTMPDSLLSSDSDLCVFVMPSHFRQDKVSAALDPLEILESPEGRFIEINEPPNWSPVLQIGQLNQAES